MKYTYEQLKHMTADQQREYFKTITKEERKLLFAEGVKDLKALADKLEDDLDKIADKHLSIDEASLNAMKDLLNRVK